MSDQSLKKNVIEKSDSANYETLNFASHNKLQEENEKLLQKYSRLKEIFFCESIPVVNWNMSESKSTV